MQITDSFDVFKILKAQNLLEPLSKESNFLDPKYWWWPNALSFEVVIGAILVQNTKWEQVEIALSRLKEQSLLSLDSLSTMDLKDLESRIKNIGFFRQKASRIQMLCQNILKDFSDYTSFCANVTQTWLLRQKGIGLETSDGILNYALGREILVVDSYTHKLLQHFGYYFESYVEMQEWLQNGLLQNYEKICVLYGFEIPLNLLYARMHGKVVEYSKQRLFKKDSNARL